MQIREIRVNCEVTVQDPSGVNYKQSLEFTARSDKIGPKEIYIGSMMFTVDTSNGTDRGRWEYKGKVDFTVNFGHCYYTIDPEIIPFAEQEDKYHGCWAIAFAVLLGWRDNCSYTIAKVLDIADEDKQFQHFASKCDLLLEPPKSYLITTPPSEFRLLMEEYGPLYLCEQPHIRIMTGISDGDSPENSWVHIFDPLTGEVKMEPYQNFIETFAGAPPTDPRIIHCKKTNKVGETFSVGSGKGLFYPTVSKVEGFNSDGGHYIENLNLGSMLNFLDWGHNIIVEINNDKVTITLPLPFDSKFEGSCEKIVI